MLALLVSRGGLRAAEYFLFDKEWISNDQLRAALGDSRAAFAAASLWGSTLEEAYSPTGELRPWSRAEKSWHKHLWSGWGEGESETGRDDYSLSKVRGIFEDSQRALVEECGRPAVTIVEGAEVPCDGAAAFAVSALYSEWVSWAGLRWGCLQQACHWVEAPRHCPCRWSATSGVNGEGEAGLQADEAEAARLVTEAEAEVAVARRRAVAVAVAGWQVLSRSSVPTPARGAIGRGGRPPPPEPKPPEPAPGPMSPDGVADFGGATSTPSSGTSRCVPG
jgi:hypothetical protein